MQWKILVESPADSGQFVAATEVERQADAETAVRVVGELMAKGERRYAMQPMGGFAAVARHATTEAANLAAGLASAPPAEVMTTADTAEAGQTAGKSKAAAR